MAGFWIIKLSSIKLIAMLYILCAADHLDNINNIKLEDNNAYEVAIKQTPLDIKDMHIEPCCAYGVIK